MQRVTHRENALCATISPNSNSDSSEAAPSARCDEDRILGPPRGGFARGAGEGGDPDGGDPISVRAPDDLATRRAAAIIYPLH
jgi:hypothetical protein